jgi:hypothetical protein
MEWHIINHRDYIDGPFDTYESALREALVLGNETRAEPKVRRKAGGVLDLHQGSGHRQRRLTRGVRTAPPRKLVSAAEPACGFLQNSHRRAQIACILQAVAVMLPCGR